MTERAARGLPAAAEVLELDVTVPEHFEALAADLDARWGGVDGALHAIAFAPADALGGKFLSAPVESAQTAFHVSRRVACATSRLALKPLMHDGGSIVGLDFDAQVAWPVYDWMGVAKAALEATSRYLARDLGPDGIRVNLVSAGPLETVAARGIPGFDTLADRWGEQAPLGWDTEDPSPVAGAIAFLLSDLARGDHRPGAQGRRRLQRRRLSRRAGAGARVTVVVTGGTGFLGGYLLSRLRRASAHGLVRGDVAAGCAPGVRPVQGDLLSPGRSELPDARRRRALRGGGRLPAAARRGPRDQRRGHAPRARGRSARCRRSSASSTCRRRTSPARTPASSARTTSRSARASATPTSGPSSRPSSSSATAGLPAPRRAPEHRRGGEHDRLDELLQRALPAAAGASPRAGQQRPRRPEAIVDVVPVDHVADVIEAAMHWATGPRIVHAVAGEGALRAGELAALAATELGHAGAGARPRRARDLPPGGLEVYAPYFTVRTRFDAANARGLGLRPPSLRDYLGKLLAYAQDVRWGKRRTAA